MREKKSNGLTAEIRVRRCYGCGAILQDKDPNEKGFIPKEKLNDDRENLCSRCFKLRHYSIYKENDTLTSDYITILEAAKKEEALVVYVINAFSLYGSFLEGIGKYLGDQVIALINKRDLLPNNYNDSYLVSLVKENLKKEDIYPKKVLVCSANREEQMKDVIDEIMNLRKSKSVYFIGAYQVGKSSVINAILKIYKNSTDKMITTSPYPGTTLDVISIPLDNAHFIYDTPGISNPKSMVSFLKPQEVKYIQPRNTVKSELYPAREGQSFLIANLARIDFVKGDKTEFTFYKSNDLTIQRAKSNKADDLFASICASDSDFKTDRINSIRDMKKTTIEGTKDLMLRIVINGLGFIDFKGSGQSLVLYTPKDVEVFVMPLSVSAK